MSKQKKTRWFPGNVLPVRAGVYERKHRYSVRFWLFDGLKWCYGCARSVDDVIKKGGISSFQSLPWRGLSSDPAKANLRQNKKTA